MWSNTINDIEKKIDEIDKRLLFELDRNARQSYPQLARRLGASKDVVRYRMRRLEKEGVINGYYALIDFSKVGYSLIRVYLRLQQMVPEQEEQLISDLVRNKNTLQVYKTDGPWDIAMGILARSFEEFYALWEQFELKYRKNVLERSIAILFKYVHYHRNYLVERQRRDFASYSTGNSRKEEFEAKDILLLKSLATDAKMPAVKLAEKLGVPVSTAIYKTRQLEKRGVILGYKAKIDFDKLGYEYYKVDLYLDDIAKRKAIQGFIRLRPELVYEDITIGGSDVEFDVEVKSYDDLYSLLTELRKAFPGTIRYYTFYKAKKIYKYIYVPET
jgi:DNA-binding Lrp family transcriptional regulator